MKIKLIVVMSFNNTRKTDPNPQEQKIKMNNYKGKNKKRKEKIGWGVVKISLQKEQ